MNKVNRHSLPAFTIFEVTVVLAIMSVLIAIISLSLNRFSEQLHLSAKLSSEMNAFRALRSELWREFYFADSIHQQESEIELFEGKQAHKYRIIDERLHHFVNGDWMDLKLEMESIHQEESEDAVLYHLDFIWKGEAMHLDYHFKPGRDKQINTYFDQLNE